MTQKDADSAFDFTDIYDLIEKPDQYDSFMSGLLEKVQNHTDHEDGAAPETLGAHWGRAASLIDKVSPWRTETKSELDHYLAAKMQGMMAVDRRGSIVGANSAARGLYNLGRDAHLDDLPISTADRQRLMDTIHRMNAGHKALNSPNNVQKFENQQSKKTILLRLDRYHDTTADRSLVTIMTNDIYWPGYLGPILQDLFDLTHAEIEVIRLLLAGETVGEIAKKRATSTTTVRTQLRSIFAKTSTGSQMECMRMVIGLALMHDRDDGDLVASRIQASLDTGHYPRESQRQLFTLKSGRRLDYAVFGAKPGSKCKGVILFYHDQAFGDTWFKDAVAAATRAGLQIIAPLRPGFGRTTLYEGEASDPHVFARDVREWLDALHIDKAVLMTLRSGLVHGLAAAQLMPDRFVKLTAANPILPATCDADLEGTNGYNLLIPKTRLHFPQALRFLCKAGFAFVTAKGPDAFAKAVIRSSPRDYEWVSRAEILPVITAGLPIHREQGYLGNYGDIAYAQDWTELLVNSPVPIRLVIGEHDRNVQWAAARHWDATLDHAQLVVLPDSGYFVQHQQPAQFLDWMLADLGLDTATA